jgi:hypothetical protein
MPDKISPEAMKLFQADSKIGLIAMINDEGYPHITMISTLTAKDENSILFGQFCEGLSKQNIKKHNKTAFLVMSPEREFWRGRAVWKGVANTGPEFEMLNDKPLFRYNTYFGIGLVYYLDLKEISEKSTLNMGAIISGAILTRLKKHAVKGHENGALNNISFRLIEGLSTLKFIATQDDEGFCNIIPIVQAAPSSNGRIAFVTEPYGSELKKIREGSKAAIFAMNLDLVSVLTQGVYRGIEKGLGVFDIDKVYNPLAPLPGYIYPKEEIKKVTDFA